MEMETAAVRKIRQKTKSAVNKYAGKALILDLKIQGGEAVDENSADIIANIRSNTAIARKIIDDMFRTTDIDELIQMQSRIMKIIGAKKN